MTERAPRWRLVTFDVDGTLTRTIELVNGLPEAPALIIHTGDITHLSKPAEFDLAQQLPPVDWSKALAHLPEKDIIQAVDGPHGIFADAMPVDRITAHRRRARCCVIFFRMLSAR